MSVVTRHALFAFLLLLPLATVVRAEAPAPVDPKWLDRLARLDRELVDELIGKPAPPFPADLDWRGAEPASLASLRGRVIVIQTFTGRTSAGRRGVDRWRTPLAALDKEQAAVIMLHTPDGADGLDAFLERHPLELPIVLDPSGAFCDALGAYRRPVNYLIDRAGRVRYAGLNETGLTAAMALLLAEPRPDPAVPEAEPPPASEVPMYPPIEGELRGAIDLRGKPGPTFRVDRWESAQPDPTGRTVALVFWDPGDDACEQAVTRLDELAGGFDRAVCVVAVSGDSPAGFDREMKRADLDVDDFVFSVALDARGAMRRQVAPARLPYLLLLSSDWIVRWQGEPGTLTAATVEQVVRANRPRPEGPGGSTTAPDASRRNRWRRGR